MALIAAQVLDGISGAMLGVLTALDARFHESCHKRGIHLGFQAPI
jgi:hypothetical protein